MKNNNDTCLVSVAFREPYVTHSKRQYESININVDKMYFLNTLPIKNGLHEDVETLVSVFQKSLYGFKPHAIQRAIDAGFKKIIWFDPSVLPTTSVQVLIDSLDTNPLIVITGDSLTKNMTNKKVKDWFGVTDDQLGETKNVGGTMYAFNFNEPKVVECFNLWKSCEEAGMFGDQDSFMKGSWADESAMSICLFKIGIPQYKEEKFNYLNQKNL